MKKHAPATARNSVPIAQVLAEVLPKTGAVLEIASGSGEHALFFARRFPHLTWQPSDIDPEALASVDDYSKEAGLTNLLPAMRLDASRPLPVEREIDAILCINMVHISPWDATVGLFQMARETLAAGGPLILYGPYFEGGREIALSNIEFDRGLRQRNANWGVRDIADVDRLAAQHGMHRKARYEMPANNLTLVYCAP